MKTYDLDDYAVTTGQIEALMTKMESCFPGYPRMVIALACTRVVAAMLGPAKDETRDNFLAEMPSLIRSIWRVMDATIPRQRR